MTTTKAKRKKLPENKVVNLTISLLPEVKQRWIDYVGNENLSAFVRGAVETRIKKEK